MVCIVDHNTINMVKRRNSFIFCSECMFGDSRQEHSYLDNLSKGIMSLSQKISSLTKQETCRKATSGAVCILHSEGDTFLANKICQISSGVTNVTTKSLSHPILFIWFLKNYLIVHLHVQIDIQMLAIPILCQNVIFSKFFIWKI